MPSSAGPAGRPHGPDAASTFSRSCAECPRPSAAPATRVSLAAASSAVSSAAAPRSGLRRPICGRSGSAPGDSGRSLAHGHPHAMSSTARNGGSKRTSLAACLGGRPICDGNRDHRRLRLQSSSAARCSIRTVPRPATMARQAVRPQTAKYLAEPASGDEAAPLPPGGIGHGDRAADHLNQGHGRVTATARWMRPCGCCARAVGCSSPIPAPRGSASRCCMPSRSASPQARTSAARAGAGRQRWT